MWKVWISYTFGFRSYPKKGLSSILIYILINTGIVTPLKYCYQGTYEIVTEDGYVTCALCSNGTFMTKYDHRERACYDCTKPDPDKNEVVYTKCNRTHDTTFICKDGFYRVLPRNPREKGRCVPCTDCKAQDLHPGRDCQTFSDSICCLDANFDVAENEDGHPMCRERPRMCGPGHYFKRDGFECIPCPNGTFMNLEHHTMIKCWECPPMADAYIPLHSVIDQKCTSTHPATFRCEDGYYRDHHMGNKNDETGCAPCTICDYLEDKPYTVQSCTHENDAVCSAAPEESFVHGEALVTPKDVSKELPTDPCIKAEDDQKEPDTDQHNNEKTVVIGKCRLSCDDSSVWMIIAIIFIVINIILIVVVVIFVWKARKRREKSRFKEDPAIDDDLQQETKFL